MSEEKKENKFTYRWCLNEEDYHIVCKMQTDWKMAPLHRRMMPEHVIIVSKDGVDVCCSSLYQSDSKIAWIEWVVISRDKKNTKNLREGAIDFMYETLFDKAKQLGFEVVMCIANLEPFIERLKTKYKFVEDTGGGWQKLLFKNLWQ